MNTFHFCHHCLLWIWGKTLRRNFLKINVRTVNVMLNIVLRVILTNPVTKKCWKCRATNIPFGRNKQTNKRKTCGEEVAEKLTTRTLIIIINFPQIYLWIHYKNSSTSFKQRLLQEFHLNSTLNIITFPPLSANVIGLGSVVQWSRSRPSSGSPRFILGDPGAVSRDDRMLVVKVHCQIETSPWELTLTQPVPEAFKLPASDWPENFFSDQSEVVVSAQGLVSKGLCNNYLEGGWEMGEICPKTKSYPTLIKQKLISTPPHIMIIFRLTPPPLKTWKRSPPIDSLIPSLLFRNFCLI